MSDSSQLSVNVGQKIRAIREQHGLSLRALSELCGLSTNAISLIERGENSPTVSSLHMLATALEVSMTSFFEDEHDEVVVFVPPTARLRSEANGIMMESLGIGLRQQQLDPFLITVAPGAGNINQPVTHAGEEFVFCLEGTVNYMIEERIYRLEPGSSLLFESALPHCFCNVAETPARLMMVFHTSSGGRLARRLHMELLLGKDQS